MQNDLERLKTEKQIETKKKKEVANILTSAFATAIKQKQKSKSLDREEAM